MKTRSTLVALAAVSLLMATPVLAALPAPAGLTVTVNANDVAFNWDDVTGAKKYSVDLEGTVTFDYVDGTGALIEDATLDVELSFGTSDRTDGGEIGDSDLTIAKADLELALISAIQDALALPPTNLVAVGDFDGEAKVKALNPGKGNGKQNNPFSDPFAFVVAF